MAEHSTVKTRKRFVRARPGRFALLLAVAGVGLTRPAAEVLAPPPLPVERLVPGGGLSAGGTSWLLLRRITDASGAPQRSGGSSHNYDYDLGGDFTFRATDRVGVHGMVRMIFGSEHPVGWSDNTWLIDSASIVVEQYLRASLVTGVGVVSLGFHHNSKHDLDRGRRRTPIHDSLRLDWRSPPIAGLHAPDLGWTAAVAARAEYGLPQVFQSETPEPYAGGLYLHTAVEPLVYRERFALFADARLSIIANSLDAERWVDLDWLMRLGARRGARLGDRSAADGAGDRRIGVAFFLEVHRLNDDWRTFDSIGPDRSIDPWTLVSVGLLVWR